MKRPKKHKSLLEELELHLKFDHVLTSRLFLRPYSPMSLSSWSRRAFSKGLLGVVYTLEYLAGQRPLFRTATMIGTSQDDLKWYELKCSISA